MCLDQKFNPYVCQDFLGGDGGEMFSGNPILLQTMNGLKFNVSEKVHSPSMSCCDEYSSPGKLTLLKKGTTITCPCLIWSLFSACT